MRTLVALALALPLLQPVPQVPVAAPGAPATSKIWIGRHAEFEEFLRTAEIVQIHGIPTGVTQPKRAFFAPGGLVASAIMKAIRPNLSKPYSDSHPSEIARVPLEQDIVFTGEKTIFLDGRQTAFHLVR